MNCRIGLVERMWFWEGMVGEGGEGGGDGLCEEIEMGGCERGDTSGDGAMEAEEGDDVVEVGFYFGADRGGLGLGF